MKTILNFNEFVNEQINESNLSVAKNKSKMEVFQITPSKIIHGPESNSYKDAGMDVTDKIIPDFGDLKSKYILKKVSGDNMIHLANQDYVLSGKIKYSAEHGAEKIISYQDKKMMKQQWYLNIIFKTASEAKEAWDNLCSYYKLK